MPMHGWGIATRKDYLLVDFTETALATRIAAILAGTVEEAYQLGVRDTPHWSFRKVKPLLGRKIGNRIHDYAYRPFDNRAVFYEPAMIERGDHRLALARHFLEGRQNRSILVSRTGAASGSRVWDVAFAAHSLSDLNLFRRGGAFMYPLYRYPETGDLRLDLDDPSATNPAGRTANFSAHFLKQISQATNLQYTTERLPARKSFGAEDVFAYIYAILHSPGYRSRYAEFLRGDFPRIPVPRTAELFKALARLGESLLSIHLQETDCDASVRFPVTGSNLVQKVRFVSDGADAGSVWVNDTQYFAAVPADVWNFTIGGYQVCHKWLKDRVGRALSYDEMRHYEHIVGALAHTIVLMATIDATIQQMGGWPIAK
jgi:predicted helicase